MADLDFAGEDGHHAVIADVQPGRNIFWLIAILISAACTGFLRGDGVWRHAENCDASAHHFEEFAALQAEMMQRVRAEFVALRLQDEFVRRTIHGWLPSEVLACGSFPCMVFAAC